MTGGVAASSPANVWVFGDSKDGRQRIFRYNGHWSSMAAPSDPGIPDWALLLGAKDARATANAGGCGSATSGPRCFSTFLHWDGVARKPYQLQADLAPLEVPPSTCRAPSLRSPLDSVRLN
jgi:hypothetical protein